MLFVGTMINFEPALFGFNRRGTGTYAGTIPKGFSGLDDALVVTPMNAIGRCCQPDKVAAYFYAAGAVQGIIHTVYLFFKNSAVLIVRRYYHAFVFKAFPVGRGAQSHTHTVVRYCRIRQVISIVYLCHAAVFYAKSLQVTVAV